MKHEEAINATKKYLHLVGKPFKLPDGETETVKAVVAWDNGNGDWSPHVCFYDWLENSDGRITHLALNDFLEKYRPETG
jgi:hypothetical protein